MALTRLGNALEYKCWWLLTGSRVGDSKLLSGGVYINVKIRKYYNTTKSNSDISFLSVKINKTYLIFIDELHAYKKNYKTKTLLYGEMYSLDI